MHSSSTSLNVPDINGTSDHIARRMDSSVSDGQNCKEEHAYTVSSPQTGPVAPLTPTSNQLPITDIEQLIQLWPFLSIETRQAYGSNLGFRSNLPNSIVSVGNNTNGVSSVSTSAKSSSGGSPVSSQIESLFTQSRESRRATPSSTVLSNIPPLTKYSGIGNVNEWLNKVYDYILWYDYDERRATSWLLLHLDGAAAVHAESLHRDIKQSWSALVSALKEKWAPLDSADDSLKFVKAMDYKQISNQSVQAYAAEKRRLFAVLKHPVLEETQVNSFTRGLQPSIGIHLCVNPPTNWLSAELQARRAEEFEAKSSTLPISPFSKSKQAKPTIPASNFITEGESEVFVAPISDPSNPMEIEVPAPAIVLSREPVAAVDIADNSNQVAVGRVVSGRGRAVSGVKPPVRGHSNRGRRGRGNARGRTGMPGPVATEQSVSECEYCGNTNHTVKFCWYNPVNPHYKWWNDPNHPFHTRYPRKRNVQTKPQLQQSNIASDVNDPATENKIGQLQSQLAQAQLQIRSLLDRVEQNPRPNPTTLLLPLNQSPSPSASPLSGNTEVVPWNGSVMSSMPRKTAPHIRVGVGSAQNVLDVLADSGAQQSQIHPSILQHIRPCPTVRPTNATPKQADRSCLSVTGEVDLPLFDLDGRHLTDTTFLVAPTLSVPVILGMDTLRLSKDGILSIDTHRYSFMDKPLQFLSTNTENYVSFLYLADTVPPTATVVNNSKTSAPSISHTTATADPHSHTAETSHSTTPAISRYPTRYTFAAMTKHRLLLPTSIANDVTVQVRTPKSKWMPAELRIAKSIDVVKDGMVMVEVSNLSDKPISVNLRRLSTACVHPVKLSSIRSVEGNSPSVFSINDKDERIETEEVINLMLNETRAHSDLTGDQIEQLNSVLSKYPSLYFKQILPRAANVSLPPIILTGDTAPIYTNPRRLSPKELTVVETELADMLRYDIVTPCESEWCSPVLMVLKKDNTIRFCIDFRNINRVSKPLRYPLASVDQYLSQLINSKYFSSLDSRSAYWQFPLHKDDVKKTCFAVKTGKFQGSYCFLRLPFGLKNSPAVYQMILNRLLASMNWINVLCYLDDILIHTPDFASHVRVLDKVLSILDKNGITLKPSKCSICVNSLNYLGFRVDIHGIRPSDENVKAVRHLHAPTDIRGVRSLYGFLSYFRSHIPLFSIISKPIQRLLKGGKFEWGLEQDQSLQVLKDILCSYPILRPPNPDAPFLLYTDASQLGIAAILSQKDKDGKEYAVSYYSRSTRSHEMNYAPFKLELLGVVESIRHYRHYLYGSQVTVITDHSSLRYLMSCASLSGIYARWALELSQFDLQILYRQGRLNHCDILSRMPIPAHYFDNSINSTADNSTNSVVSVPDDLFVSTILTSPSVIPISLSDSKPPRKILTRSRYRKFLCASSPNQTESTQQSAMSPSKRVHDNYSYDPQNKRVCTRDDDSSEDKAHSTTQGISTKKVDESNKVSETIMCHHPLDIEKASEQLANTNTESPSSTTESPSSTTEPILSPIDDSVPTQLPVSVTSEESDNVQCIDSLSSIIDSCQKIVKSAMQEEAAAHSSTLYKDQSIEQNQKEKDDLEKQATLLGTDESDSNEMDTELDESDNQQDLDLTLIMTMQMADPTISPLYRFLKSGAVCSAELVSNPYKYEMYDGVVGKWIRQKGKQIFRILAPTGMRQALLVQYHSTALAGHRGIPVTLARIQNRWIWPNMRNDIDDYVRSCPTCTMRKARTFEPTVLRHWNAAPSLPFQTISVDITYLPTCRQYPYVLVIVDWFSRYCITAPMKDQTADTIANIILNQVILRFGVPSLMLTDRGSNLTSIEENKLYQKLGIRRLLTSSYHPACNGAVERVNSTLKQTLRLLCDEQHSQDWVGLLAAATFSINSAVHRETGYSPFYLLHGYEPRFPMEAQMLLPDSSNTQDAEDRLSSLHRARLAVTQIMRDNWDTTVGSVDENPLTAGQLVIVKRPVTGNTLDKTMDGPYTVIRPVGPVNVLVASPSGPKVYHISKLAVWQADPSRIT